MSEGWALPRQARLFHYFREGRSLCRRYDLFTGTQLIDEHTDTGPDEKDCTPCRRKLEELR